MFQTGRVQSASKKIPDVMFAEMLKKQNRLSSLQVSRDTRSGHPTQPLKTTITAVSFAACLPCLNERELEQQFRNLNLEIRSWPEYFTNVVRPIDNVQCTLIMYNPAQYSKENFHKSPKGSKSAPQHPMSGQKFIFRIFLLRAL